jgi:hypothetical protein
MRGYQKQYSNTAMRFLAPKTALKSRVYRVALIWVSLTVFQAALCMASGTRDFAQYLATNDLLDDRNINQFAPVLKMLVKNTAYAKHVEFNKISGEKFISIILFDSASLPKDVSLSYSSAMANFSNNCKFTGERYIVVCDTHFVNTFLRDRGVLDDVAEGPAQDITLADYQSAFIAWVIGHEIGHIVNGDSAAHFKPGDGFENDVTNSSIDNNKELKADLFAERQIARNRHLRDTTEGLLLSVINNELRLKIGPPETCGAGIYYDPNSAAVITYLSRKTHPEFIIRASRMLMQFARDSRDPALSALLSSFASHLREAKPGSS